MSRYIPLGKAAKYVKDRIASSDVTLDDYVTTDNIEQNKAGISKAVNLPPQGKSMPKYEVGHTLVANIRPYLRKIWYATKNGGCSADVLTFEAKPGFHPKYIYYCLFQDIFYDHMMRGSKGSKMPRGDKKQILDFPIPDISYDEQKRIAELLSFLDSKIELNNRINAELEAMAKTIYDYWFVQFDFPISADLAAQMGDPSLEGKPYKSSGGAMVWDERLKREVPEGWTIGELTDIADITMGQSPPGGSYNDEGKGTVFYQGCTDFGPRFPTVRKYTTQPTRFAKAGDILLSVRAPVGTMNIANEDCCIGRGLAALKSKNGSDAYLYEVLKYFKQIFDRRNVDGTTFGAITKNDLHSLSVVMPPLELISAYEDVVGAAFKKLNVMEAENRELASLRDWLLPMLMNGQVKVSSAKANEQVGEVKEYGQDEEVGIATEEKTMYNK